MINLSKIIENRRLVLGRNERYLKYIRPFNLRNAIKIADDKTLTKKILIEAGIPVPKLVKVIKNRNQLSKFDFDKLPKSFVIKPVKGVRGGGVIIVYNRNKEGKWIGSSNRRYTEEDLRSLIQDILDGRYSLFNEPDKVLIEERVRPHKSLKYYSYKGAPDVRVLIFNSIPVMSYIRLPTKESDGKANLDLGAIAAGIDMAVGKTTTSIIGKSTPIEYVPNTNLPLSGVRIPYWDKILRYACEASKVTGLGFGAVDFLIDEDQGPIIVEMNARPGLSIQLANQDGLRWRLKKASGIKVKTTERAVRLAKDLFGGEIEEEIESISGKQVIGLMEEITIQHINSDEVEKLTAKIDTGATFSSIDISLATQIGLGDVLEFAKPILESIPKTFKTTEELRQYSIENNLEQRLEVNPLIKDTAIIKASNGLDYRIIVGIKLKISGIEVESNVTVANRSNLTQKIIIGEKDLKKFLIDPSKKILEK
jgi:alpha-L-glutamate ligase-like protein